MPTSILLFIGYFMIVSIIAVVITVMDKSKAIKNRRRIPESTLLLWSAFGGSVAMLLTMLQIRHKTRHIKFMIGIPVIIFLQAALIYIFIHFKVIYF